MRSLETGRPGLNCDPAEREYDAHRPTTSCVRRVAVAHAGADLPGRGRAARGVADRASPRGDRHRPVVPRPDPRRSSRLRAGLASCGLDEHDAEATGGAAKRIGFADAQLAYLWGVDRGRRVRAARLRGRRRRHVQDGRHVRGGVRGRDAVPLRHLRGQRRGRAARPAGGRDPRQRPEPHRPGRRVRLLLRARRRSRSPKRASRR